MSGENGTHTEIYLSAPVTRMSDLETLQDHVLIVDDEFLIVMGLQDQIEDMGWEVCATAANRRRCDRRRPKISALHRTDGRAPARRQGWDLRRADDPGKRRVQGDFHHRIERAGDDGAHRARPSVGGSVQTDFRPATPGSLRKRSTAISWPPQAEEAQGGFQDNLGSIIMIMRIRHTGAPSSRKIENGADRPFHGGGKQRCAQKARFLVKLLVFFRRREPSQPPPFAAKRVLRGLWTRKSDTIGWRFRSANFGCHGSMETLGIFLPGVSNEIEAEFNTRT